MGLLDNPTIQQPLPGTTTPQKDIPTNTDLLSNLDDNLITKDDKTSVIFCLTRFVLNNDI